ncbi:hypothetical protein A2U01_0013829, partial [Trifolium medium]|nr:hypothetical protein [Trifolium medium]
TPIETFFIFPSDDPSTFHLQTVGGGGGGGDQDMQGLCFIP